MGNTSLVLTPIEAVKPKYISYTAHLQAIEDAIAEQFNLTSANDRSQIRLAVTNAYLVGRGTITTEDWINI